MPSVAVPQLEMVDLHAQYLAIKEEVDAAVQEVIANGQFIHGPVVAAFERELGEYLGGGHIVGVGNGTDALQIAFMALGVGPGDEIITSAFTFVATAEAAALLGARPVFADIDPFTFNLDPEAVEALVTPRTKALVPVHLFGQSADMAPLLDLARRRGLHVVEDAAQAVGAQYQGKTVGFLGDLGTLSFFPSKNLGAFGDGGAVLANDDALAARIRLIANHGSKQKYRNEIVGVNSRLDALQAAILRVKLRHLDAYASARTAAADRYDRLLADLPGLTLPHRAPERTHVFHQYTLRIAPEVGRDRLAAHLKAHGVPHAIYYPVPLHRLPVFAADEHAPLPETERAAGEVISLPMHTELSDVQQAYITDTIRDFVASSTR